jgi:hypothetical protein
MAITITARPCPDTDLEINGTPEGSFTAGSTIDLQLTDGVNPVTPLSVGRVGNTMTVEVAAGGGSINFPLKTGQTVVYATNDDASLLFGREVDWLTLSSVNAFNNVNRFTDVLGGSSYSNGVGLDWAYADHVNKLVIGWQIGSNGADINWTDAIVYCEGLTLGTFNDWHLPNDELLNTIKYTQGNRALNYPPFNDSSNVRFWSSTTPSGITTANAMILPNQFTGVLPATSKTTSSAHRAKAYRIYTYAELGL